MLTGNPNDNNDKDAIVAGLIYLSAAIVTVVWMVFLGNLIWQWTH